MYKKQVDKSHYKFSEYVDRRRWMSLWYQLDAVLSSQPNSVLELGPGPGLLKAVVTSLGYNMDTMDVDPELNPDHVGSAVEMKFGDRTYDVVCAFQVLEHLPFEQSVVALQEMSRVARDKVIISLPDAKPVWRYVFHVPKFGTREFLLPRPTLGRVAHRFDGEHFWEINKRGYSLKEVHQKLFSPAGLNVIRTFRANENPYHRFFILSSRKVDA